MSVRRFFAWIRSKRHSSTQPQLNEGVIISTRLKELRDAPKCNPTEIGTAQTQNDGDQGRKNPDKFGT